MSFERRDNSGIAFLNQRQEGDKRPNFKGDVVVNGTPMKIAVWERTGAKGPFLTFSFESVHSAGAATPAEPQTSATMPPNASAAYESPELPKEDIPF